jgi:hypothetical protein
VPWPALATLALVAAIVSGSAVAAQVPPSVRTDPALGSWVLVPAKSTIAAGQPVLRSRTFEVVGDRIRETIVADGPGAPAAPIQYEAKYDRKDVPVSNAPVSSVSLERRDDVVEKIARVAGRIAQTERRSVSSDGRELTVVTVRKTDAGDSVTVQTYHRR